jgi:hypothetical protein
MVSGRCVDAPDSNLGGFRTYERIIYSPIIYGTMNRSFRVRNTTCHRNSLSQVKVTCLIYFDLELSLNGSMANKTVSSTISNYLMHLHRQKGFAAYDSENLKFCFFACKTFSPLSEHDEPFFVNFFNLRE